MASNSIKDMLAMPGTDAKLPRLGFGCYLSPPKVTQNSVSIALKAGYRHIDTAQYYENEAEVGKAVKESGLPRSEVTIVSKILFPVDNDLEKTFESVKESVHKIGDYVDIFLIHTPSSGPEGRKIMWQALERLKKEGLAKDIGVSNFGVHHIKQLAAFSSITPVCNQIELHPFCQQREIVKYCKEQGIVNTAYCPIVRNQRSDDETLVKVAKAHDKPVTQILLKWSVQKGFAPLIKSDNESRIKSNMELDGWELTSEQMESIDKLDEGVGGAIAPCPVNCE